MSRRSRTAALAACLKSKGWSSSVTHIEDSRLVTYFGQKASRSEYNP
jgi:hypothetical protein